MSPTAPASTSTASRAPNTVDAHRLILHAAERGKEWPMAVALSRGYFTEGLNLNDPDNLAEIAADAGLDTDEARAFLAGDSGTQGVWESQRAAAELSSASAASPSTS